MDTQVNSWRFSFNQDFNRTFHSQTEGRAAQTALPSWCFRAGHCAGPSVHALENFKGMEEWKSRHRTDKACTEMISCYPTGTAAHGTACVHPFLHVLRARQAILTHSSSQSHSFVILSENLSSQMGPKGSSSTRQTLQVLHQLPLPPQFL